MGTLAFHKVLASFCNRERLNFQAFELRDIKMAAREGRCVGQKMTCRFKFVLTKRWLHKKKHLF